MSNNGLDHIFGQRSIIGHVITDDHCKCGPSYDQGPNN